MFDEVDWKHREEHIRDKHNTTPQMAHEALVDPDALVYSPDPRSDSGHSIRVIGYSPTAEAILAVIVVPDPDGSGTIFGATCHPANTTERNLYRAGTEATDG